MKVIKVTSIERNYSNWGQHCEQALAYTLTGEIRKHDHVPFFKGCDIPEFEMSVKSSNFSLASPSINPGKTFAEKWTDYTTRTKAKLHAYVTMDFLAYVMNEDEFSAFVHKFCKLDKESGSTEMKIRCKKETKEVRAWLASHAC